MKKISTVQTMTLDGGDPSLDFVNSGYDCQPGILAERLHEYADLLTLSLRVGLLQQDVIEVFSRYAKVHPAKAIDALEKTREVRGALYELLIGRINPEEISVDNFALDTFNRYLGEALRYRKVAVAGGEFSKDWIVDEYDLEFPLRRFVIDYYELITGPRQGLIKQCDGCAWFFLDQSKNHRRRWCDMSSCGNIEKVRRYYGKRKVAKEDTSENRDA
ncbi:MAG: hypothetical protein EOO88_00235 [Pedobacter sp.]|nr:MAG: hypothetical protein EOO88_00235 [Pedobacter sp.]